MKNYKLKYTLILIMLVFGKAIFAQNSKDSVANNKTDSTIINEPNKLKFGCGFGLNFVGGTNISISPNITYSLSNKISIGAGVQGSYLALKNVQFTTTFGGNVLGQLSLSKKIMATIEFVQLHVNTKNEITSITRNFWDAALFVGAGLNITSKILVGGKYNFLYKENESAYTGSFIPFVNITF